jgi:hypothetical protein
MAWDAAAEAMRFAAQCAAATLPVCVRCRDDARDEVLDGAVGLEIDGCLHIFRQVLLAVVERSADRDVGADGRSEAALVGDVGRGDGRDVPRRVEHSRSERGGWHRRGRGMLAAYDDATDEGEKALE